MDLILLALFYALFCRLYFSPFRKRLINGMFADFMKNFISSSESLSESLKDELKEPQELDEESEPATPTQDKINLDASKEEPAFKIPAPVIKISSAIDPSAGEISSTSLDSKEMFPMVNGPQRASAGISRQKVPLGKGLSPHDWQKLKEVYGHFNEETKDLRGVDQIRRFRPSELIIHNTKEDCYLAIKGKVFNCTAYLPFHPGGKTQLMRGAGKDATELFNKVHPWVNAERILDKCFVGYLINE